jgi:hypothetical protein
LTFVEAQRTASRDMSPARSMMNMSNMNVGRNLNDIEEPR